ncbi:UNVERIFIED_CONTAM: Sucrose nonfermenting 4-like protein [Sesamum calycinum]|uniref:Sucrose nonfermenting 4-like protein n=1 Tax=Sesamum calycinum TaxID=2727403 RepID=A0AAW2R933_9LAMI
MTPVEGCPTVFQTICSLPPGYHQGLRLSSPILSPQVPPSGPGSSMDVDNEAFQRVVRLSDGTSTESLPMISDADLEISRHRITVFMSAHTAYELLPESGKVIALDVDLPVKQAFHILHEQLGSHGSNLTEEELETHTIAAWKEAKSYQNSQVNGLRSAVSRPLVQAGPDDSLKEVALKILQNGVATVPILHSSSADGSNPHLLHLASLSGILKCICRFFKHSPSSLPVLQLPLFAIPVGTWVPKIGEPNRRPLAMLRPSASLSAALSLLIQAQVSSIPIVDDNDSLLDVYSRSDITTLAKDKIYAHINLEETTIHQALQYRDDPFSTYGHTNQRCHMCLRSDPLHKVLERLSQPGVRRLIIIEAGSKRVEGIITLSDVFRFLLGS